MPKALTADDLLPLVAQLEQQVRLAKLALRAAASDGSADAARYAAAPPTADELGGDPDALAWDADGWEDAGAKG
jgi:hypothetical protein